MNRRYLGAALIVLVGVLMSGVWIPRMQALADTFDAGCSVTTPPAQTRDSMPNAAVRTYPRVRHVAVTLPASAVADGEDPTPVWPVGSDRSEVRCVIEPPREYRRPPSGALYALLTGERIAVEMDPAAEALLIPAADGAWQRDSFLPSQLEPLWKRLPMVFGFGVTVMGLGIVINWIWGGTQNERH